MPSGRLRACLGSICRDLAREHDVPIRRIRRRQSRRWRRPGRMVRRMASQSPHSAIPAVLVGGGRYLARSGVAKTYEVGINQRTVLVEFDSLAQAIATYDSPGYQAALAVLGNAAERDVRIVEGVDD